MITDEEVKRWDEWFDITGLTEAWNAVKTMLPQQAWINWASIIELNRIEMENKRRKNMLLKQKCLPTRN